MIYKVGLLGASGRVGCEVAVRLRSGYWHGGDCLELADAVTDDPRMRSIEGVAARTFDTPALESVHVWIDFSAPAATMRLLDEADCPLVIGTTGLSQKELGRIREYAKSHAVLLAPNMSPGMNLMLKLLAEIPRREQASFEAVLSEEHHRNKKDAPSGTAKKILEVLGTRGYDEVPTNVTRAGAILGVHSVKLVSDTEELELRHHVGDRGVFAEGAFLAALYVVKDRQPGVYAMQDVFALGSLSKSTTGPG